MIFALRCLVEEYTIDESLISDSVLFGLCFGPSQDIRVQPDRDRAVFTEYLRRTALFAEVLNGFVEQFVFFRSHTVSPLSRPRSEVES